MKQSAGFNKIYYCCRFLAQPHKKGNKIDRTLQSWHGLDGVHPPSVAPIHASLKTGAWGNKTPSECGFNLKEPPLIEDAENNACGNQEGLLFYPEKNLG
jgi:hypothetical protein